jgi:hypothetical protein
VVEACGGNDKASVGTSVHDDRPKVVDDVFGHHPLPVLAFANVDGWGCGRGIVCQDVNTDAAMGTTDLDIGVRLKAAFRQDLRGIVLQVTVVGGHVRSLPLDVWRCPSTRHGFW